MKYSSYGKGSSIQYYNVVKECTLTGNKTAVSSPEGNKVFTETGANEFVKGEMISCNDQYVCYSIVHVRELTRGYLDLL